LNNLTYVCAQSSATQCLTYQNGKVLSLLKCNCKFEILKPIYMFKKLLSLTAIFVLCFAFTSCKKEEGCTDKNATNYSVDAEEDDGTCTFKGSVVFWYNQNSSAGLYNDFSESLLFYVDGNLVGSTAVTQYWSGAPSCGSNGSITVEKDLGLVKSKSYNYQVIDDWGDVIWEGNVNIDANSCYQLQLVY